MNCITMKINLWKHNCYFTESTTAIKLDIRYNSKPSINFKDYRIVRRFIEIDKNLRLFVPLYCDSKL